MRAHALIDVPFVRETPPELSSGLEGVDPSLFAVALCRDRWLVAWRSDHPEHVRKGRRMYENTRRAMAAILGKHPGLNVRDIPRFRDRIIVAAVRALGVTGCKVYRSQYPHSALVAQVRADDFYQRHTTESAFWADYQAVEDKATAEREAQLTDPHRANDAWKYAFTRSHAVTRSAPAPRASGRTLVTTI